VKSYVLICVLVMAAGAILAAPPAWVNVDPSEVDLNGIDIADVPGEAAIINGDTAAAREMALADARRKAIEQVLGAYVDSRVVLQNELLSVDSTFVQLAGAATVQNVYSESEAADGFYRLRALVKVYPNTLTQALDRMAASALVNVRETILEVPGKDVTSGIIRAEMAKGGFKVIDPEWLQGQSLSLSQVSAGDATAARKLGTRYMADIIIVGEVVVTYRRNLDNADIPYVDPETLKGLVACEAKADVRAIDPKTGKVITAYAAGGREIVGIGPTKAAAADEALRKAAQNASDHLVKNLPKPGSGAPNIELTVRGIGDFKNASQLSGILSRLRGVESVKMGSFDITAVVYNVAYRDGEAALALELSGLTSPTLSVITMETGKLSVRLEH